MQARPRLRRFLLLLAVLVLPGAAVVALGVRTVFQERQLAAQRSIEERLRTAREIGSTLVSYLEDLQLHSMNLLDSGTTLEARDYGDPAIVFVARMHPDGLTLPWEGPAARARARFFAAVLDGNPLIREGERQEAAGNPNRAATLYSRAVASAEGAVEEGYARLLLGRALRASDRIEEARTNDQVVLSLGPEASDENGIPLTLYAAQRLAEEVPPDQIRRALDTVVACPHWLPPEALHLAHAVTFELAGEAGVGSPWLKHLEQQVAARIAITEFLSSLDQTLRIIEAMPPLASGSTHETRWWMFGDPGWLVARVEDGAASEPSVLVTDPRTILESLQPYAALTGIRNVRFVRATDEDAVPLGPRLPNLRLAFELPVDLATSDGWSRQSAYLGSVLILVLALSALGAYLLWRDVRREVQVAALRSGFVSSVSHELRTPLAAIRMFADILREKPRTGDDPEGEYLESIAGESERLSRLLDNVLDFSKIERGEKRYHRSDSSLSEVVNAVSQTMRYILEKDGFHLTVEVEEELPQTSFDADAIEQAILNLVTNAMKYSGESHAIVLRLRGQDGYAVIEVEDQGIGIDREEQERIFDQFFRGSAPESDNIPGTGLGLTVVRHIIDAHDGFITLESEPGTGSTFALHLPFVEGGK